MPKPVVKKVERVEVDGKSLLRITLSDKTHYDTHRLVMHHHQDGRKIEVGGGPITGTPYLLADKRPVEQFAKFAAAEAKYHAERDIALDKQRQAKQSAADATLAKQTDGGSPRQKREVRSDTMSDETDVAMEERPVKKKVAKGIKPVKGAKKASVKKAPVKKAVSNGHAAAEYGVEKSHDLPWNPKKVAIFKALKQMKAVGTGAVRPATEVAERATKIFGEEVKAKEVRHYCYHAKVSNYTLVEEVEGSRGYGFALTAKGAALDPAKELKEQEAAKAK